MNLGPQRIVGDQQFKNASAPCIACLTAVCAACALAVCTNFSYQSLCQHTQQRRAKQERFNAHVGQARDGTGRIVGVQSGQHQVTCHGGLDGNLRGFKIANLANHDDVRVLSQNGAQGLGKGQINFGIDLRLTHARQLIFNRVFHRHDVAARGVQTLQCRIQRGGFARASRACDQNQAMRLGDQLLEAL